jgi:hypothetical protein
MEYKNIRDKDVIVSIPLSVPVHWVVVKKGETKELSISSVYAEKFGLYTEAKVKRMDEEKEAQKKIDAEQVEAEELSIGSAKIETKVLKKKASKKNSKKLTE